ncbi:MAG: carboxypeptidase-like regulatory domain-containing protein [Calditrichaeota bacterium]|nr:MAG: carboxypeptidase-like regulatory domain-containing protein [Calditrichota bacterium]
MGVGRMKRKFQFISGCQWLRPATLLRKASFLLATCIPILIFPRIVLSLASIPSQPSAVISGRVVDAETGEPLASVNVFLAQTTLGDATDRDGRFSIPRIPPGHYQLIVSRIGYEMQKVPVHLAAAEHKEFTFKLKLKILPGGEVTVVAKFPKDWKRNLEIFENTFFGLTDFAKACKLLNPEVLDFKFNPKTGHFEASAEQPVRYINRALGYEVSFILEHYTLDMVNESLYAVVKDRNVVALQNAGYRCKGILKFKALPAKDEKEAKAWEKNRQTAYFGSFQHFLKSLWAGRLKQQGFEIFETPFPHAKTEHKIKIRDILHTTSDPGEKMLSFPGYLEVVYKKENDPICERMQRQVLDQMNISDDARQSLFIEKVYRECAHQVSWIKILNKGNIMINQQGQILTPEADLEFAGYWKWNSLAESMPINYDPGIHH